MAAGRYKREMAMARLWMTGSGGESSAESSSSSTSSSSSDLVELEDLVDSFYLDEEADREKDDAGSDVSGWLTSEGRETAAASGVDDRKEWLAAVLAESEADSVARRVRAEAERAAVRVAGRRGDGIFKRRLVVWLRNKGFDAGLCKSAWESEDDGISAGKHEFIDVIDCSGGARYILETDFAAEFEIARPSGEYASLLRGIPPVFVGRPGAVESVVRIMCAAMKESVSRSGMHLPPWRRREYVRAKWLGSYKRMNCSIDELQEENEGLEDTIRSTKKTRRRRRRIGE